MERIAGAQAGGRIAAIDFLRGITILGILAVNIDGFAGPIAATLTPDWNGPVSAGGHLSFAIMTVLFEGKMRALLSLMFGASMLLFIDSLEAAGRNGEVLQLRRLAWLAVIGYLHFLLLWWGDILFTYAFAGFFALLLRRLSSRTLLPAALAFFVLWHGLDVPSTIAATQAEQRMLTGTASIAERSAISAERTANLKEARLEQASEAGSYANLIDHKLGQKADLPMIIAINSLGETLPLMLIGMVLYRSGFFSGGWLRRRLVWTAILGIGLGGLATVLLTALAWSRGFPPRLMDALFASWMAVPHLVMAMGYAAALLLLATRWTTGALRQRIVAIGRMALSNYLGCSLVMTALFYGWGLGLGERVPESALWAFVAGGWIVMLLVSQPWLARFRQGPIEWLWRSLTNGQRLPFRR